jgi:hypothetical protein
MKYLFLIYGEENAERFASSEATTQLIGAFTAYTEAMRNAGILVGGERLRPVADATTVRIRGGKQSVLDGPFADTKEQLGGYYMVDVPDLDAALSWAARCPSAQFGSIEVRPIWTM